MKPKKICFSMNKPYVNYVCICVKSLLRHTANPEMIQFVFLLNNDVTENEIIQLRETVCVGGASTPYFLYPEKEFAFGFNLNEGENFLSVSNQTPFYRIMLPELLEDDECLYLDTDIAVCGDVLEIFNSDIKDAYIMGVTDRLCLEQKEYSFVTDHGLPFGCYVNSGVLRMNLKRLRENDITKQMQELGRSKFFPYLDQDIINYTCKGNVRFLEKRFNVFPDDTPSDLQYLRERIAGTELIYRDEMLNEPVIIHYIGPRKPWKDASVKYAEIWLRQ